MQTILGIDGGGTKTTFLMVDADDRELARVESGGSNYNSVGVEASRNALAEGIGRLPALPDVIAAGFAGAGRPAGVRHYYTLLRELVPAAEILIESDAHVAYAGALGDRSGVVLVAGTGSVAIGGMEDGTRFRYGGWGPQFGDEGSGFWIGREAIRTALAFHEDRRSSDFPRFVAHALGVDSIENVIPAWTDGGIGVEQVARLTESLADHFPEEPGYGILKTGADHLRRLVERAMGRFGGRQAPVVAVGSVANHPVVRNLIGIPFEPAMATPERGAIYWARERLTKSFRR